MTRQSNEFFYLDDDGNKQDDWLHDDILANGDEAASFAGSTYPMLKERG